MRRCPCQRTMKDPIVHALSVFMGFFAIMNPIANTPIFLGLTADDKQEVRKKVAARALLLAFVLVCAFALLGKAIFTLFGITQPAFQIAGGVLVALIGYSMLHGEPSAAHHPSEKDQEASQDAALSVAITPLALPILAGPGTIATAMSFASEGGMEGVLITVGAYGLLCIVTFFCFVGGERLAAFLGQGGLNVITRIMGLILTVIGVQMLIEGVFGTIKMFPTAA